MKNILWGFDFQTGFGWAAVICNGKGEVVKTFLPASRQQAEDFISHLPRKEGGRIQKKFRDYFAGKKTDFKTVPVSIEGVPPFHRKIYKALMKVPYGARITYGELAAKAGNPKASRAVGSAMARNPIPLIVPCHRVVRSDGGVGNFSAVGGVELKRLMLEMEQGHRSQLDSSSMKG